MSARRAYGYCGRGGHRVPLHMLVEDGEIPGLLVDKRDYDPEHPQKYLVPPGPDGEAIRRPAPRNEAMNVRVTVGRLYDVANDNKLGPITATCGPNGQVNYAFVNAVHAASQTLTTTLNSVRVDATTEVSQVTATGSVNAATPVIVYPVTVGLAATTTLNSVQIDATHGPAQATATSTLNSVEINATTETGQLTGTATTNGATPILSVGADQVTAAGSVNSVEINAAVETGQLTGAGAVNPATTKFSVATTQVTGTGTANTVEINAIVETGQVTATGTVNDAEADATSVTAIVTQVTATGSIGSGEVATSGWSRSGWGDGEWGVPDTETY